jgi:hypothetical protein
VAAGDHTTGRGPAVLSSQLVARSCAAAPDDLFCGRTKMQSLPSFALSDPLNDFANDVIRSPFSGDVAMSTTMHLPGPSADWSLFFELVHAATASRAARTGIAVRPILIR